MKILVTGTDGYLGCLLAPELLRDGHEVVGVDTGFYKSGWLYSGVDAHRADARQGHPAADAGRPRGRRRRRPHGRAVQRPARRAVADASPTRSTTRARCGWPSWPSRPGSSGSSTCPRAASTAWPTARSTRPRRSTRRPRTPSARRWSSATCLAMATDTFSPTFLRNATAFGASPRMRFDIVLNNLAGLAWTDEEDRHDQRRHAVAAAGARPRHRQGDPLRAGRARSSSSHGEVFNVGSSEQNYRVREIAEIVGGRVPGLRGELRRRRRRQPQLPGVLRQDQQQAARVLLRLGRRRRRPAAARRCSARSTWTRTPSPAAATPGCSSWST